MAVRKINESTLTAIGNAIRAKTGGSALIKPEDMADEIGNISTGGGLPTPTLVTVTGGTNNDVLTQCRTAVNNTNIFVVNKRYADGGTSTYLLYLGIYCSVNFPDRDRLLNTTYRKNASGSYGNVDFTSTATSGGLIPSGEQFLVWGLDYIDYE